MRGRFVRAIVAVVAGLSLLQAGPALAQTTSPFSPGLPSSPPTVPAQTTPTVVPAQTTTTSGGSELSGTDAVLIGVGALVVLAAIGFFIWHDARKRAPVHHRTQAVEPGVPGAGKTGSKARAKPRKLSPAERRRRKRGRAR